MQDDAPATLKLPAAQGRHEDWPALGLNVPAAQLLQPEEEVAPAALLYEPAEQGTQAGALA